MPTDLDQVRAERAFAAARDALSRSQGEAFLQQARRLPTMMRTNGLLAAWAYLKREGKGGEQPLAGHLEARYAGAYAKMSALFDGDPNSERLTTVELQALSKEALLFAGWLKRAAEAVCEVGQTIPSTAPEDLP